MKTHAPLVLFFFLSLFNAEAQVPLTGNWYSFSAAGIGVDLLEITFKGDSMVVQTTSSEGIKEQVQIRRSKIVKVVSTHNNLYYLTQMNSEISVLVFSHIVPDSAFMVLMSGQDVTYNDTSSALISLKNDTVSRLSFSFYSEKEYLRMKNLPSFKTIEREKFKMYLMEFSQELSELGLYFHNHKLNFTLAFALYPIEIQKTLVIRYGYSPIFSGVDLNAVMNSFKEDKEIQSLIEKTRHPDNFPF